MAGTVACGSAVLPRWLPLLLPVVKQGTCRHRLPISPLPCLSPARREWVASEEGESVATQLISVLVGEHLLSSGGWQMGLAGGPFGVPSGCSH